MNIEYDNKFAKEISACPGGENICLCYACGTCTASCPVSALRGEYNPRRIIRQALLGQRDEVLGSKELWLCSQCHACVAHCPQDVRFADIMRALRDLAVKNGYVKPEAASQYAVLEEKLKKERLEKLLEIQG